MRFLLLTQYFAPEVGAPQTRLASMVRVLREEGHEVCVVTAMPSYPQARVQPPYRGRWRVSEEIDGTRVERTWIRPVRSPDWRRLIAYGSFQLTSLPVAWRLVRHWRPDYLFIESPPLFLGLTGVLLKRLTGVRTIFNVADLWPDWAVAMGAIGAGGRQHRIGLWIESLVYRHADHITGVTEAIVDAVERKGVPRARLLFLPNGTELPEPGRAEPELAGRIRAAAGGRRVVLYAGTHGAYHGLEAALEAARLLAGDPVFLAFVGDGAEKPHLVELARRMELDNVAFYDPVPAAQVAGLLAVSDVALSVIRIPTRAAKALPAMAAGVPLVYAGRGEGADLITEADAGLVVSHERADEIAAAIRRLATEPELAARLGANGRAFVQAHLTWRVLVRDWLRQLGAAPARQLDPAREPA